VGQSYITYIKKGGIKIYGSQVGWGREAKGAGVGSRKPMGFSTFEKRGDGIREKRRAGDVVTV